LAPCVAIQTYWRVVVLGFVSDAEAVTLYPSHDYTIEIGDYKFGFEDYEGWISSDPDFNSRSIYLGPLGHHKVPFTATHGLIGFCFVLAVLVIVPVVFSVRWKKKRAAV
jgi:hypothetical protein